MTKYSKGNIVEGVITGLENYGIFVRIDNYYSGLIHISEISNNYVKNINDYAKIGDIIYAEVIDVNEKDNHVKLSIKNITYKGNQNRLSKRIIKETGTGFNVLGENLETWIKKKMEELT